MTVHRDGIKAQNAPRQRFGAAPLTLFGVVSTWIFALLPANMVPYIIGGLTVDLAVPLGVAGVVATSMTLANAAGVLVMRAVVARGHRALVARIGIATLVTAFTIAATFFNAPVVMATLVIGGLGSGILIAAATASVSAVQDPDRATTVVITFNRVLVALIFFLLPIVGSGIRSILLILIAFGLVAFVGAYWLSSREMSTPGTSVAIAESVTDANDDPSGVRAVAWLLAVAFAVWTISEEGVYGVYTVLIQGNFPSFGESDVSLMVAIGVLAGIVGAASSPLILRGFGRAVGIGLLLAISTVAKVGLVLARDEALYLTSNLLWGFAFGAIIPLVFGLAAKLSPSGSANVLVNGVYVIGVALGPLISTQVLQRSGVATLATVMTVLAAAAAAAIVIAALRSDRIINPADKTEGGQ